MFSAGFSWLDAMEESRARPAWLAGPAKVTRPRCPCQALGTGEGPFSNPAAMDLWDSPGDVVWGHQQHPLVFAADASLQFRGWGGVGSSQSLSLLTAPASPFTKNSQQDHTPITHCPSSIRCPCPHPLHAQMPVAPHTCPHTRPPRLLLLSLPGWGQGHAHRSVSRRECNAGGKHISGSLNAIHGRGGCAGAGLGTRICLQR